MRIAVLGLGSWGTAVAARLASRGHAVRGWTIEVDQRELMTRDRENRRYLPGLALPESLEIVETPPEALAGAETTVFAVPSHAVRSVARASAQDIPDGVVVNLAKGLEETTLKRMLEVLGEELAPEAVPVSLVGPSHAEEVALDFPTAVVATGASREAAASVQRLFSDETFRVYTNEDALGVELAVSLKNVIAVAAGISSGLGFGDNSLGTLITRGLAEMTRLGTALGAQRETFYGLAGVGDLVTTCASRHSRNRRVGEQIASGKPLDRILEDLGMVAEGVRTARAANALADQTGTEMPIVREMNRVLFEGKNPKIAIRDLMSRGTKSET